MSEVAAPGGFVRLLSDDRLARRAVDGDERAFAAIFRRYHQSLYRFCLAIVGNPEDAQDALQNTMMKVLRALPGEEREIDLKPWLYRIAHNESIDLLRKRRETRELDVEQAAPGHGLAEGAATRERLRRLLADLRELPERQREVLVMRELAGLDFDGIGVALGTSSAVARQTLYEARQSLHQMEEGREMNCDTVTLALSDGDGRVTRRRDVRAHLRSCASCRRFGEEIKARQRDFAAFSPLPAVAAAGMLQGLVGGGHTAAGGGLAATLGGGAVKSIGASAAVKGAATVAVVAAIGVTAADRSGVIHLGLPGEPGAKSSDTESHAPGGAPLHPSASSNADSSGDGAGQGAAGLSHGEAGGEDAGSAVGNRSVNPAAATKAEHHTAHGKAPAGEVEGPAAEHPHNHGHEQQHPEAAGKGEETAAEHKPSGDDEGAVGNEEGPSGDENGASGDEDSDGGEQPVKPTPETTPPAHPVPPKGPPPAPGGGAPADTIAPDAESGRASSPKGTTGTTVAIEHTS